MSSSEIPFANWEITSRNYEKERLQESLSREGASSHPLQPQAPKTVVTNKTASASQQKDPLSINDPLSAALMDPLSSFQDPLSSFQSSLQTAPAKKLVEEPTAKEPENENSFSSWEKTKADILARFVYVGDVMLSSSNFNEISGSGVEDGSSTRYLDKYTQRLASLETRHLLEDKVTMTQAEYEKHVKKLAGDLALAWSKDERVGSLKIAIQIAKLLGDTTIPQFYPSIFVTITNELDKFGKMVFQRLRSKAEEALAESIPISRKQTTHFPEVFKASEVPSLARETCRNWFYKIACIKELIPRIYVEMALLKCYKFLTDDEDIPQILTRLSSIIRGIGDPLIAVYARLYLNLVGSTLTNSLSLNQTLVQDTIYSLRTLKTPSFFSNLETKNKVLPNDYFRLLSPALEWLIKASSHNATKEQFQTLLSQYRDFSQDNVILKYIIDFYDYNFYSHAVMGMLTLVKTSKETNFTMVDLFAALGKQFLSHFSAKDEMQQKLQILNEIWKVVSKTNDIKSYVKCFEVWVDVIQKHFSQRELLVLLRDLGSKLQANTKEVPDYIQKHLESIVVSILNSENATVLLSSENLLQVLDTLSPLKKTQVCKEILLSYRNQPPTGDIILINTMFYICRVLHDSFDSLSSDSEKTYISYLLTLFIQKIDFGRDLEQQLNILTECRSLFCNLDSIKDYLVLQVGNLALKVNKLTKGKHTKKTSTFAKSCLAYCHITIPSISDGFRRLELLIFCAEVALANQCLPQTDSFLKASVVLLPELLIEDCSPSSTSVSSTSLSSSRVSGPLHSLLSLLVVCPGHPEHGPFYLLRALALNINKTFHTNNNSASSSVSVRSVSSECSVLLSLSSSLCALSQSKLPYHIDLVQSNDELYCTAGDYTLELTKLRGTALEQVYRAIQSLESVADSATKTSHSKLCLDFVNHLIAHNLIEGSALEVCMELLSCASKNRGLFVSQELAYFNNTVKHFKEISKGTQDKAF